jgi:hypothetical protein
MSNTAITTPTALTNTITPVRRSLIVMLILAFEMRLYLRYFGQYVLLIAVNHPVYAFDYHPYTVNTIIFYTFEMCAPFLVDMCVVLCLYLCYFGQYVLLIAVNHPVYAFDYHPYTVHSFFCTMQSPTSAL